MSILSKNLKLLRKESYLSFEEIVEKIGTTEEEFLKWEQGTSEPSEYLLEKACLVLKMPYEDIRERDLSLEREETITQMRGKKNRKNYDWYFGSKTQRLFYLGYIVYFVLGLTIVMFVWDYLQSTYDYLNMIDFYPPGYTLERIKLEVMIGDFITCFEVFAFGAGIFMAVWYLKRHTFTFNWWYILWFGVLITIFVIVSSIACIPFFVYSIIQLFPKNKKIKMNNISG